LPFTVVAPFWAASFSPPNGASRMQLNTAAQRPAAVAILQRDPESVAVRLF